MLVVALLGVRDNQFLQLVRYLIVEHPALLGKLLVSSGHHFFHEDGVGLSRALEVDLGLQFLGVAISNCLLNSLNVLLSVLLTILLHRFLLLFLDCPRPNLHIVYLFSLVELEGLTVSLQNVRVEGHDLFIVKLALLHLHHRNLVFANLLDSSNAELPKNLPGTLLLLLFEALKSIVDLPHVGGLDLILLELDLPLLFLLELLVAPVLHLSLSVPGQVLLRVGHRLLHVLDPSHLLVELALDLLEDADTLSVWCALSLDLLEDRPQFVAEAKKVFVHL